MYALYEDAGKFHAGRVMSEADSSMQIELDSGKRVKVKAANVLLRFEKPQPAELIASAQTLAGDIDLDLAWEFAPEAEFGFADLARDYFEASAGVEKQAAALFRLFDAPHYFRRLGKGNFRKAPEEIVKAALLGIERKKQVAAQIDGWATELVNGACPTPVREQLYKLLFKPDKNAPEYKAVVEAARRSQKAPLDLLKGAGAIDSPYQFHWRRFLFENFPKGTAFPALGAPAVKDILPLASVRAFSIDDSATTEIDDALSVQGLGSGSVVFGVHIAAPGLALGPDTPLDKLARERLSTVYMPGYKLTMLPDEVVQSYTLMAGRDCPAVSLYVSFDEATLAVTASETRLERVPIAANLRHDQLDTTVTEASLTGEAPADYEFAAELAFAFRLARHLKALREAARGKPETFNRPDYTFRLDGNDGHEPAGTERVSISTRLRGAPLDLIVAEAMILANSTWGGWLADCGVPGIYRSQASLAPGVKVRMGVKPAPHAGMGVAQYTWATSPLRRYVDLVNQWQLIACARHGRTAALAAPFKPKDVQLFAIISAFDAAYAEYNGFQSGIERYWTLKYLAQNDMAELNATVMKDGLVRADELPLVFRALGAEALARGAHVRVRITGTDLLTLDVHANVLARLDDTPADAAAEDSADDALDNAGPLTLAIDIHGEAQEAEASSTPPRLEAASYAARLEAPPPDAVATLPPEIADAPESGLGPDTVPDEPPELVPRLAKRWRTRLRELSTLQLALLVSLTVHAGLLTVRLVSPDGFNRMFQDSPLEVILVNSRSGETPTKAQAIAQANLAGGGALDKGRATSPLPPSSMVEIGDANEETHRQIEQLQETQLQLLAQVKRELALLPTPDPRRDQGSPEDRAQEDKRRQLMQLLAEIEKRINEENARPKKRYISPATREEVYALYYDQLRRKVEDRGTRDFPEVQGRKIYGELTMNVTVNAKGELVEAEVVRPSKSKVLDRRAVAIVRAAAPFGEFSPAMRRKADELVITSRFRFTRDDGLEATMTETERR